jgi:hypothetical protein
VGGGVRLRPATAADVPRLTELVEAAYGHYVDRLGGPPRPLTDDYAAVVRNYRVTVAEREGEIVGLLVLGTDDEGFVIDTSPSIPLIRELGSAGASSSVPRMRRAGRDSTRSTSTPTSG